MKLLLRKGEHKWSSEGSHVLNENGFAIVLEQDLEIEFHDEKIFEYVTRIVSVQREIIENQNKKEIITVDETKMIPIVAEPAVLKKLEEPVVIENKAENKDIPVSQFFIVVDTPTS